MGQFIADVWNGRTFSLAKHYWLFLAVPSAIFSALVKVLEFNSLSFNPTTYGWVAGILWTITLIAFGFGYVGLINCARVRRFRGWSAVAVTVASLSLVLGVLNTVDQFSAAPANDIQQLYDSVMALNARLPKKVDAMTTVTKVDYSDGIYTYYYDIDPTVYQSPNWSTERLKRTITSNACETFKGILGTRALRTVRYVYKTSQRPEIVIEVAQKDCEVTQ